MRFTKQIDGLTVGDAIKLNEQMVKLEGLK